MAPKAASSAENELVRDNLPLVRYAVNELAGRIPRHVPRDDLVSAGMAGLAQAARSFDPARGVPFDRFAATRIKGALLDELRRADWASRSVRRRGRELSEATEALTSTLGRTPTDAEVAAELGVGTDAVQAMRTDIHRASVLNYESLSAVEADDVLPDSGDSPDDTVLRRERIGYLVDAVATLPDRLRRVIVGYYLDELPMAALATELGVTESRISQMRSEALSLLRDGISAQLDPEQALPARRPRAEAKRREYHAAIARRSDYRTRISAPSLSSLA